ncbi:MAG: hypothetical protein IIW92_09120 [Lachnospiraceae bacterium]|nr:hypothetical protein [Lachnospiraceae bacterium]
MEELKSMKKNLINCVQGQINGNLKEVDAKELGEAVDMIKDLEEAIYYATITKAMNDGDKEKKKYEGLGNPYQQPQNTMFYPVYLRDMDRNSGRMYYDGNGNYNMGDAGSGRGGSSSGSRNYQDHMMPPYYEYPMDMMRDHREGRSPMSRKNYMESKEKSHDVSTHMKELEKYLQELSQDVTEMIQSATPEEKQLLQQKISLLATKIK